MGGDVGGAAVGLVGVISFSMQIITVAAEGLPSFCQLPQYRQFGRHVEDADVGERLYLVALGPNVRLVACEENRTASLDRRIEMLRIDLGAQQLA